MCSASIIKRRSPPHATLSLSGHLPYSARVGGWPLFVYIKRDTPAIYSENIASVYTEGVPGPL